jgi:hypothetical protein
LLHRYASCHALYPPHVADRRLRCAVHARSGVLMHSFSGSIHTPIQPASIPIRKLQPSPLPPSSTRANRFRVDHRLRFAVMRSILLMLPIIGCVALLMLFWDFFLHSTSGHTIIQPARIPSLFHTHAILFHVDHRLR